MKPLNNAERKAYKLKFISMYGISIILIIIALSSFLQPAVSIKKVVVEKQKPAHVITKTVYVTQKNASENNLYETDSLKTVIDFNERKVAELNADVQSQKNTIAALQKKMQPEKINRPVTASNKAELDKLNKQIEFLDWALRSQVAVTNTLTKENNSLKTKIVELGSKN